MKKIILALFLIASTIFAEYIPTLPTKDFVSKHIPIVDIRTPAEWKQTGIIKGAIPIMFFDSRGGYNVAAFLEELKQKVDVTKPFALICHTGNRTKIVATFLAQKLHYTVYDLRGGMDEAARQGITFVPYNGK